MANPLAQPAVLILLYGVIPLWLAAGFADWCCHRAAHIETTAGAKESLLHLLMFLEVGPALLAGIFLEINAGIMIFLVVMFFVHEATAYWDVAYATSVRRVSPFEQHVHSYLNMMPLLALVCVLVAHWNQAMALIGVGPEHARFDISLKTNPLPMTYVAPFFGAVVFFEIIPYLQELGRSLRANRGAGIQRAPRLSAVGGDR